MNQDIIGLSLECGEKAGRSGSLKFVSISTRSDIYIFKYSSFGINLFKWGLFIVLDNSNCMKVVHDARLISDLLYHQMGLELENVFDTLAGHLVVANWMIERKLTKFKSLGGLVCDYLGVIQMQLLSLDHDDVMEAASRNCQFLIPLRKGSKKNFKK